MQIETFITMASAIFAFYSAKIAWNANRISIHNYQLQIYMSLIRLHGNIVAKGKNFDEKLLWGFVANVRLSQFYLDRIDSKMLKNTSDLVFKLYCNRELYEFNSPQKSQAHIKYTDQLLKECRVRCNSTLEILAPKLALGSSFFFKVTPSITPIHAFPTNL